MATSAHSVASHGQLESHFHTRFADIRCSSDSFLYSVDSIDHYADLENYCDDMNESKVPLLLLGESGVGKSAMLANWTIRRKRNRRKNVYLTNASSHEFIFWHAVGCTRHSVRVDVMLRRLMTELKNRFDLQREVPVKNERLSWDLPRFLDQASKKGGVIIVIDGINYLTSEDGTEIGLTWLPLEIPPNVRIIVSVSIHTPLPEVYSMQEILTEDMIHPKRPRFVNELNRRQWLPLRIRPLDLTFARSIIMLYFHKTVHIDGGSNKVDAFITALPGADGVDAASAEGLILFPSHVEDLMRHKCVSSPLFLRLILESLSFAASHGYCIWTCVDQWLAASSYSALVGSIITAFENGFRTDENYLKSAKSRCFKAGGKAVLKSAYPWHPSLQSDSDVQELSESHMNTNPADMETSSKVSNIHMSQNASVLDSLENPEWIATFESVQDRLNSSFDKYKVEINVEGVVATFARNALKSRRMSFTDRVKEVVTDRDLLVVTRRPSVVPESFSLDSVTHLYDKDGSAFAATVDLLMKEEKRPVSSAVHRLLQSRAKNSSGYFYRPVTVSIEDSTVAGLPSFLLGGQGFEGLGPLLGNALALLYTSFCGLSENELWNILVQIKDREAQLAEKNVNESTEHRLIYIACKDRGLYEDIWRTMDVHKKGVLAKSQFVSAILKVEKDFFKADVDTLMRLTGFNAENSTKVNYKKFVESILALDRTLRVSENANRMAPLQRSDESMAGSLDNDSHVSLGPMAESSLLFALRCVGVIRSAEYGVLTLPLDNMMLREVILEKFLMPRGGVEYWHNAITSYFIRLPSCLRRSEELPWHLECTRKWFTLKNTLADLKTFDVMSTSELCYDLIRYWQLLTNGPLYTKISLDKDKRSGFADDDDNEKNNVMLLKNLEVTTRLGLNESVSKRMLLADKVAPFDIVEVYNKSIEDWAVAARPSSQDVFDKLALVGSFLLRFCQFLSYSNRDVLPPYMRLPVNSKILADLSIGHHGLKFMHFDGTPLDIEKEGVKWHLSSYVYSRRWMWIQFPWFALKYKLELCHISDGKRSVSASVESSGTMPTPDNAVSQSLNLVDKMGAIVDASRISSKSNRSDHMRGFWELKKLDPTATFDSYQKTKRSDVRSYHRLSSSLDIEEFSIMNFSVDSIHPARKLKPLHKYRRSLKDTIAANKSTRFASPSRKSIRHNTLFPSVARDLLNRHIDIMKTESDPFELAAACARAGDKEIPAELDLFTEVQNIYTADVEQYAEVDKVTTVEEETSKLAKLRMLADKAKFIYGERAVLLDALRLQFEMRESIDYDTTEKLLSGEEAIKSLEKKAEVVAEAIEEGESMNRGYQQVLLICEQNPPHTKHHVNMVDQELKLAKQQLLDLIKLRQEIYSNAAQSDIDGSKFIIDQASYYEKMKLSTREKKEKQMSAKKELQLQMLRNGFQKEDIDGYFEFSDDEYVEEVARLRDAWRDVTLSEYNSDHIAKARLFMSSTRAHTFSGSGTEMYQYDAVLDKDESIGDQYIIEAARVVPDVHDSAGSEYRRVLRDTKSKSIDDLIHRFIEAQILHSNLTSQGAMAESKVVLLRAELQKLTSYYVDITISSNDKVEKGAIDANLEQGDNRALDDKLIMRQLQLNQIVRQTENAENLLNEIRSGVYTLMGLLEANASLMSNLAQKAAPPLQSNSDIGEALAWCEEKLIAITEVLLYDTSKLAGKPSSSKWQKLDVTNDNQPLPERQVELAVLVEGMLTKLADELEVKHSKSPHHRKLKKKLGLSRAALQTKNEKPGELRSPRAILVPPKGSLDADFEEKVRLAQTKQDTLTQQQLTDETFFPESLRKREALEMSEFVSTALSSHDSSFLLRRHNRARSQLTTVTTKASKQSSRGWALDSLLKSKELEQYVKEFDPPSHLLPKKKMQSGKKDIASIIHTKVVEIESIPSREELKQKVVETTKIHHHPKPIPFSP